MITLEGYVDKKIYESNDFKIYSFYPLKKYKNSVRLNPKYENISISGEMPILYPDTLYKIDVEYSKKGQYDNYAVQKIYTNNQNVDNNTTVKFLESILSPNNVTEIMKHYPDIIDRVMKNKEIDTSKLYGIKEKKLAMIKEKIVENFQLIGLVDEYKDFGMTFGMMKNLYNSYSSVEVIIKKMEEDPYTCLCKLNRVGFKTADEFIMNKYPHKKNSYMRAEACVHYLLTENETSGNTWIEFVSLYAKFKELASESSGYFTKVIDGDKAIFLDLETKRVSFKDTRECEETIRDIILQLLNNSTTLNIDYNQYNDVDGVPLTMEQKGALKNLCNHNVNILTGFGGTGKSFSVKAIIDMMDDNEISYMLISPTGKASKVLAQYTRRETSTIHRGLQYKPKQGYVYNKDNPVPKDVIIVDEFSMIDVFLLRDLLMAVDTAKTKVLFIGDPAQIPSVGAGNIAYDILQSNMIPTTLLTNVFRYGEGGLSYVATNVREGNRYLNNNQSIQTYGVKKDYVFVNTIQENSINCMTTLYNNLLKKGESVDDIMVLTSYNKGEYGTIKLNNAIQQLINPTGNGISCKRNHEEIIFREKDKVMQIKNNYKAVSIEDEELAIFNGDIGIITKVDKEGLVVDFDGVGVAYEKSQLDELNLAYALSIHKSQGSSSKYVILITPKAHKFFLDRNILYVATSRAKEMLYHIGSLDVIESSLRKSQNLNRNTWLLELLKN